jgi:hypothetical protein
MPKPKPNRPLIRPIDPRPDHQTPAGPQNTRLTTNCPSPLSLAGSNRFVADSTSAGEFLQMRDARRQAHASKVAFSKKSRFSYTKYRVSVLLLLDPLSRDLCEAAIEK